MNIICWFATVVQPATEHQPNRILTVFYPNLKAASSPSAAEDGNVRQTACTARVHCVVAVMVVGNWGEGGCSRGGRLPSAQELDTSLHDNPAVSQSAPLSWP